MKNSNDPLPAVTDAKVADHMFLLYLQLRWIQFSVVIVSRSLRVWYSLLRVRDRLALIRRIRVILMNRLCKLRY